MRSRSRALSLARERAPSMHAYMHAEGSGRVGSRAAYACMYACPRHPWAPDTHSATAAARRRMRAIVRGRGRILGKPHPKKVRGLVRVFMRTESGEAVPGKRDRGVCTRKSPGTPQKSPPALGGYPGDFLLPFGFLNSLQVQRRRIIIAFYHRERLQGHQFFTRGSFVISNDPWRVVGLKSTHPNPMYSENKY